MIPGRGSMLSYYELLASEKHLELLVFSFPFTHTVANLTRQPRVSVTVLYLRSWLEPQGHACANTKKNFTASLTTQTDTSLRGFTLLVSISNEMGQLCCHDLIVRVKQIFPRDVPHLRSRPVQTSHLTSHSVTCSQSSGNHHLLS
jgi:hypothetical protein